MPTTGYISGSRLRIAIGTKAVLGATSCSLNIAPEYVEVLNKDTADSTNLIPSEVKWSLKCSAHVTFATDATHTVMGVLADAALAGTSLAMTFCTMTTAATPVNVTGDIVFSGNVRVDNFDLKADVKQLAMGDYSFKNDGVLTKGVAA